MSEILVIQKHSPQRCKESETIRSWIKEQIYTRYNKRTSNLIKRSLNNPKGGTHIHTYKMYMTNKY